MQYVGRHRLLLYIVTKVIEAFVLSVPQIVEIVEISVKVVQLRQDDLLTSQSAAASEMLTTQIVHLKVRRGGNPLVQCRECKEGGPIPPTENALSSSWTSVLPLSNSVHKNHTSFRDITLVVYASTNSR
ncbi:hypothetical protein TNCV_1266271 [Trichonephila clavipes]|nr:hypothetical protein TNCV_1266271 [Trichonephila clavipes]